MPMQIFDYVMLLVSVVLSLGLARLLETHARLVKRGTAVKWSAVYVAWLLILAAMHVDLWATLWAVHTQTAWPWTMVLGFFFQAIALFYGAVMITPDDDGSPVDLWQFHLDNRRRYIPTMAVYTVLGSLLTLGFVPMAQFLSAVYTVSLPYVAGCLLAMASSARWVQRGVAIGMIVLMAWYFAIYLPGFSG